MIGEAIRARHAEPEGRAIVQRQRELAVLYGDGFDRRERHSNRSILGVGSDHRQRLRVDHRRASAQVGPRHVDGKKFDDLARTVDHAGIYAPARATASPRIAWTTSAVRDRSANTAAGPWASSSPTE